jgi:hypothetical protein
MPGVPGYFPTIETGRILLVGGRRVLRLETGGEFAEDTYSVVQPSGAQWFPRVWIPAGRSGAAFLVEGDLVVVGFIRGKARSPVILGTIRPSTDTSGLVTKPSDAPPRDNIKLALDFKTDAGVSAGKVQLELGGAQGPGARLDAAAAIKVYAPRVELGGAGGHRLAYAPELFEMLIKVLTELVAVGIGAGVATPDTASALLHLALDQASGGGTLSTRATRAT